MEKTRGITAVVLAAGTSARMGRPKLLLEYAGRTLVEHAVAAALGAGLGTVVVTGHAGPEVRAVLAKSWPDHPGLQVMHNPEYRSGMASSLRVGLEASRRARAVVVCLADQPLVTAQTIRRLVDTYLSASPVPPAVVPVYRGARGNPVLLDSSLFPAVDDLSGDTGARDILRRHAHDILHVECGPEVLVDVDTPGDYRGLLRPGDIRPQDPNL
ncbi:MAG: nucleotidyltransferase family protein [Bacillota bacterium]